jgi:hypothetical protein
MLWFYISALVILMGAEMNAEIEHAAPYGKDVGEKVPGQKRKIGPAAMRPGSPGARAARRAAERGRGQGEGRTHAGFARRPRRRRHLSRPTARRSRRRGASRTG